MRKATCPVFRRFVDPGLFSDPRLERALCGAKPRAPRPAAVARPAAYTVDDGVAAATLKQDLEGGVSAAPARGWRRWGAGSFFTAHFLASASQVFFRELLCAPPVGPGGELGLPPSGNHNAQPPANRAAKDRPCAQRTRFFEPPVGKATDLMIRNGQRKLLTCRSIASTAPETSG